MALMRKKSNQY